MQTCLTDPCKPPRQTPGMDLSKMTLEEVQALLRLLAEFELEGMVLLMREADQQGQLH